MTYRSLILGTLALSVASCGQDKPMTEQTPSLAVKENVSSDPSSPIKVENLCFTPLSGDSAAAYFKKGEIIDVVGDTMVILEKADLSRLILFSVEDGRYLGEINHRGQGPGEYRVILGAFVNDEDGTVLVPDFDKPYVYKYSLTTDTLVSTIERKMLTSMIQPIGGITTAINVALPTPDGLTIYQYDRNYRINDSIAIPGFVGGNFTTVWSNAGNNGMIMIADTLYTLTPGALKPAAILSRGEYGLTLEKDREITMKMMDGADELQLLKPYILVRDVQITDDKMLLTTMHDGQKYSDLYDISDGKLLYRSRYDELSIPSCVVVETVDGNTFTVRSLFAKDGRWYGFVDEETMAQMKDGAKEDPLKLAESNCAIVYFTL